MTTLDKKLDEFEKEFSWSFDHGGVLYQGGGSAGSGDTSLKTKIKDFLREVAESEYRRGYQDGHRDGIDGIFK